MCFFPTFLGSKAKVTGKDLELARGINYNRDLSPMIAYHTLVSPRKQWS